jgi:hypothetical protein
MDRDMKMQIGWRCEDDENRDKNVAVGGEEGGNLKGYGD